MPLFKSKSMGPILKMKYNAESKTMNVRDENGEKTRLRCYKGIRLSYPYITDEYLNTK